MVTEFEHQHRPFSYGLQPCRIPTDSVIVGSSESDSAVGGSFHVWTVDVLPSSSEEFFCSTTERQTNPDEEAANVVILNLAALDNSFTVQQLKLRRGHEVFRDRGILRFWQIGLTQSEGAQLAEVTVNPHSARDLFGYQIGLASQERMNTLRELYGVRTEAEEEGYPIPADVVVESAEHVLIELLPFCIQPFEVYPTPDGEVALDNSSAQGSVILLCEPAGTVLCLVNIGGEKEWKRFGSADNRDAVKYVRNKIVRIR